MIYLNKIVEYLKNLNEKKFYGKIIIEFQDGKIVLIREEKTYITM